MDYNQHERALVAFRDSPRMGRSNQFSDLFGTSDQQSEYIAGILIVALIISCFFFCWGIFICILKCMGPMRVGFLSGGPYDAKIGDKKDPNPRILRGRIVFGLSGMLFITFTFLLLFLGFGNLEQTTTDMSTGARLGSAVFVDSRSLLIQFRDLALEAAETRDILVDVLQEAFETGNLTLPDGTDVTLPPNRTTLPPAAVGAATTAAKYKFDDIDFQEEARKVAEALYALDDMIKEPATELKGVLDDGEDTCNDVADGLDEVELRRLQLGFGIPYTVVPFVMLVLMVLSAMGVNNSGKDFCVSIVFMPLFVVFVTLLVLLTAGISIAGIVDGDFCSGGTSQTPDETIIQIMDNKGLSKDTIEYQAIQYVVLGCDVESPTSEYPLEFVQEFEARLDVVEARIREFGEELDTVGIPVLSRELDVNITNLDVQLMEFRNTSTLMLNLLDAAIKELACQRLYDIYQQVIHNATCQTSTKGLNWTFSALLVMSFCGCMMMMFRATMYAPAGADEDDYSWNEVKEQEMLHEGEPVPNDEIGNQNYVAEEGLNAKPEVTEAPMGGQAQQRYEAVGDDNPFEDNDEGYSPKKSAWQ